MSRWSEEVVIFTEKEWEELSDSRPTRVEVADNWSRHGQAKSTEARVPVTAKKGDWR